MSEQVFDDDFGEDWDDNFLEGLNEAEALKTSLTVGNRKDNPIASEDCEDTFSESLNEAEAEALETSLTVVNMSAEDWDEDFSEGLNEAEALKTSLTVGNRKENPIASEHCDDTLSESLNQAEAEALETSLTVVNMSAEDWDEDFSEDLNKTEVYPMSTKDNPIIPTPVEIEEDNPTPEHLSTLQRLFGHKKFRPLQWKIISSILNHKRDNCAIMSTGYGKSLCFQYPSAFTGGVTFVISPLISLMEDQVLSLTVANIPACLLGTANSQKAKTFEEIRQNKYRLVYLTPEFCGGSIGKDLLEEWSKTLEVTLIAIDEAHCVSSWGHDFRGEYRKLGKIRELMPNVPILAVTATATEKVKEDIIRSLKLRNPQNTCTSFDRPNFYFGINMKKSLMYDFQTIMEQSNEKWKFSGPTIVYCITRKETEQVCSVLAALGVNCAPYHAGLGLKSRKETHEKFVRDQLDVVVATVAYGMGIDKPDIRNVIHYGVSNSIESYYQEVGRAGRDGQPANCISFYSSGDFRMQAILRESIQNQAYVERKEQMIEIVRNYIQTNQCRRQFILQYFQEKLDTSGRENCCDNCLKVKNKVTNAEVYTDLDERGKFNFSADARLLLRAVDTMSSSYGLGTYVSFLRGSRQKKLQKFIDVPPHGLGNGKQEVWWNELGEILISNKLLKKSTTSFNHFAVLVGITDKGREFMLDLKKELIAEPTPAMLTCLKTKGDIWKSKADDIPCTAPSTSTRMFSAGNQSETAEESDERMETYRLLKVRRTLLAARGNCMPYMIASDKALLEMAARKPKNIKELEEMKLDGFTATKLNKFGKEFLDVLVANQKRLSINKHLVNTPMPNSNTGGSALTSYNLFRLGKTINEIAEERGCKAGTIESHIISCLKSGFEIKLSTFGITYREANQIIDAICKVNFDLSLLTPIKLACPDEITFNQIRAVTSYLEIREHLTSKNLLYEEFDTPEYYEFFKRLKGSRNNPCHYKLLKRDNESKTDEDKLDEVLQAIDDLKKSENEDDTDADLSTDEPIIKKWKCSILDSPPRADDIDIRKHKVVQANVDVKKEENPSKSITPSTDGNTHKEKKEDNVNLPPWLSRKRVA